LPRFAKKNTELSFSKIGEKKRREKSLKSKEAEREKEI
jgi:hypothetical protein